MIPTPADFQDDAERVAAERALEYMDLHRGHADAGHRRRHGVRRVVHNGRIEDLRAAAEVLRGRTSPTGSRRSSSPVPCAYRWPAEAERLDKVFVAAGAEWRNAGCSMCLGMNADKVAPGGRSASTSNRNFEGRQGPGSRTHLVSPQVAAATAVLGHLARPPTART